MNIDSLNRIAQIACDAAISAGAEFADVSTAWSRSLSVEIRSNAINSCDARTGGGISVRAIYKGGTGWATCDKISDADAAEAGVNAAKLAKLAEPDPDFISLPSPVASYPHVDGLADEALAGYDVGAIIKVSLDNIDGALAVCPDAIVQGGFGCGYRESAFANSLGISLTERGSHIGGHTMVVVKRGDDVGSFYDFDSARVLSDFVPDGIGCRAAEQAMKFLGSRKIDTARMPVVLGPLAGRSVFDSIVENVDADAIQRGRSFMMGKLGHTIGPDMLTLTDDPLIPRGLGSRPYDSEGVSSKPLVVVENGVLKSYLYSTYTAGKAGVQSTGHGTRGGGAESSNVVPQLGEKTSEQIIKEVENGIYMNIGGISPSGTTGDVSCAVDFGFKIENGELAYPVAGCMIGGKFLDMLANLDAISCDYREEPGMIMPTIRIQDVLVSGGR